MTSLGSCGSSDYENKEDQTNGRMNHTILPSCFIPHDSALKAAILFGKIKTTVHIQAVVDHISLYAIAGTMINNITALGMSVNLAGVVQ